MTRENHEALKSLRGTHVQLWAPTKPGSPAILLWESHTGDDSEVVCDAALSTLKSPVPAGE